MINFSLNTLLRLNIRNWALGGSQADIYIIIPLLQNFISAGSLSKQWRRRFNYNSEINVY